jgi:hypothetical protein
VFLNAVQQFSGLHDVHRARRNGESTLFPKMGDI